MKQFRAVYEYKKDLLRGAGCCFAIAETEALARAAIESAMPGVKITQLTEEQEDPLAQYERRPHLSVVPPLAPVAEHRSMLDEKPAARPCANCGDTRPPQDFPGFARGTFMVCPGCSVPRVLR